MCTSCTSTAPAAPRAEAMDSMGPIFECIQSPLLRELFIALSNERLNKDLEEFFSKASDAFDPDMQLFEGQAEEHKLEYTQLWRDYQALLERAIDDFCAANGTTPEKIYAVAAETTGGDPVADAMLDVFVSTSDYKTFVGMCVERAKTRRDRADAKGDDVRAGAGAASDAKGCPPSEAKGAK